MVEAWDDPYTRFVDPMQLKEEEIEMEGGARRAWYTSASATVDPRHQPH